MAGKEVSFKGKALKLDTANDAKEIVEAIKNAKDLTSLCLEGNTIGLESAKVIAEALKDKKLFKSAHWSDIFTGRLRSEIPPSLEALGDSIITAGAHLHELDLSDNAFGPDGVRGIKKLLMSPACYSLEVLKLNNNGLGQGGGKILSEAFIACYEASKAAGKPFSLKVFISGRNRLEDPGALALSKAFKILGSLEEIQMPQNGIRPDGVKALAEAFQENKNLRVLNINDNTCTESGAAALAKCIPQMQNLEILNLGDCLLKDRGAVLLSPALAVQLPKLKEVILSFNEIRRDGAIAVVGSMKNKNSLTMLNLDGNQLGEDGAEEVQEKMAELDKIDALAPLDENEDPDSDEDEEEGEGEGGEEVGDDDGGLSLQIKGMGLAKDSPLLKDAQTNGESTKAVSVEDVRKFVMTPSAEKWKSIPPTQRKQMLEEVTKSDLLPECSKIGSAFVHVSSALQDDADGVKEAADCILRPAFTDPRCTAEELVASILIYMGLLKGEEKLKEHEKASNLKGPLNGLVSIVPNSYFPSNYAAHLIAFLMKPNSLLDSCQAERHSLLQKLHQK